MSALRELGSGVVVASISAAREVRRARFEQRSDAIDAGEMFGDIADTPVEAEAETIAEAADFVVDTSDNSAPRAIERVLSALGHE